MDEQLSRNDDYIRLARNLVNAPKNFCGQSNRTLNFAESSGLSPEGRAPFLRRRSPSVYGPTAL
jgi:hypothetical protein